jgi:hypothetical protein
MFHKELARELPEWRIFVIFGRFGTIFTFHRETQWGAVDRKQELM